jgi:hypothetical protein
MVQTAGISDGPSFRAALLGFVASTAALATLMVLLSAA